MNAALPNVFSHQILRVMPRTNEDINEEWISDKSRFACDGLKRQRLTYPMMKDHTGELKPCDWEDAVLTVAKVLDSTPGDKLAAVVGGMADAEVRAARYRCQPNTGQESGFQILKV